MARSGSFGFALAIGLSAGSIPPVAVAAPAKPRSEPATLVEIVSVGFHAGDPREKISAARDSSGWKVRRSCSESTRCVVRASVGRITAAKAAEVDEALRAVCERGSYTNRVAATRSFGSYSLTARCGDREVIAYDMSEDNPAARLFRSLVAG